VSWQARRQQLHRLGLLTKTQLKALQHAAKRGTKELTLSSEESNEQADLLARVTALGFTAADLVRASVFLRDEAPLLIHVGDALADVLNDTHYRSGFERGTRLHCGNYVSRQWPLGDLPAS
jgi:hypothetical protein